MARKNVYGGKCLFCGIWVEPLKGCIKMTNPQRGDKLGKPRNSARKYGVLCEEHFQVYKKSMMEKYNVHV